MRKVLLVVVGIIGIAVAAAPFATATRVAPGAASVHVDAAGPYHPARVLEPGSRGSVVEI